MDRLSFRSQADAAGFTMLSNLVLLDTGLSDGAKVTYLVLLLHARQAASCFPGQEKLASERGISERSVRSHLAELASRGLVTVERRGKARTNLYWIESLEVIYRKETADQGDDRKNSAARDRKNPAAPEERLEQESHKPKSETLNVAKRGFDKSSYPDVERIVGLTGDKGSTRRFAQLFDICLRHSRTQLWDEAVASLKKRIGKTEDPLRNKGAYFCKTLTDLLLESGVSVPVGSKTERDSVKAEIRASMNIPESES